jgi:hypothetical protein
MFTHPDERVNVYEIAEQISDRNAEVITNRFQQEWKGVL